MKSRVLLETMLEDLHGLLGTSPKKDINRVKLRYTHEGENFLSLALPLLDDLLLAGLSEGRLPLIRGWRTDCGRRPLFLNKFWIKVFDDSGDVLPTPCVFSIRAIRQVSRAFKKVRENCSEAFITEAVEKFVETDLELSAVTFPKYGDAMRDVAHYAFGHIVGEVVSADLTKAAKHGPGAVADRLKSTEKWNFDEASPRLLEHLGHEFFRSNWFDLHDRPVIEREIPARLIAVPKTANKPRLISIEPSSTQFGQQAYASLLDERLNVVPICRHDKQELNQLLAKAGSIDGSVATIDLSEASDRVHYGLLKWLFGWNPSFVAALSATRSREVQLPDGRIHILNKYASMGSALTFPVETMVFTIAVLTAVCATDGIWSRSFVRDQMFRSDLRVYGDDIIVPTRYVPMLIEILESMGLKVNTSKSFWSGLFRESCGADWYAGKPVKPVYVRKRLPQSVRDVDDLESLSSFRDQWLLQYGEGEVTRYVDSILESILGTYPCHPDPTRTPAITRRGPGKDLRWNAEIQVLEFKAPVVVRQRERSSSTINGRIHGELRSPKRPLGFINLYSMVQQSRTVHIQSHDKDLWTHHGRPTSAILKRRWLPLA